MSKVRITIPKPIEIVDNATGKPLSGIGAVLDLRGLILLLFANPNWILGAQQSLAQASILRSLDEAIAAQTPYFELAKEDHALLVETTKKLRSARMTTQGIVIEDGIGYTPQVIGQLAPLFRALLTVEEI